MALAQKLNTAKSVLSNTKSRVIVIILAIIVVLVLAISYTKFKRSETVSPGMRSSLSGTPNISSIPGLGDPTREYAKLQEQQNQELAAAAARKGTSAIPTIVRTTYLDTGVSNDLSEGSGAASTKGCSVDELSRARASGVDVTELRCRGCSLAALKAAGFSAGELQKAGFSAKELKKAGFSAIDLKNAGFSAKDLKGAGFTASELANSGFSIGELKKAGYADKDLKKAGFDQQAIKSVSNPEICDAAKIQEARNKEADAASLRKLGCSVAALKAAGYSAAELKAAGFSAGELQKAGFSAKDLKGAGFSAQELKAAGFSAKELSNAGFTPDQLSAAGYTKGDLIRAGAVSDLGICDATKIQEARNKGTDVASLRKLGCSAAALKAAGYSAAELKAAGFSAKDLSNAGFTPDQLSAAGYTKGDLIRAGAVSDSGICDATKIQEARNKGTDAASLRKLGCSAAALKAAGYSAAELKAAGFSAEELQRAGFSAKDLNDAGFTAAELHAAGFPIGDLKKDSFEANRSEKNSDEIKTKNSNVPCLQDNIQDDIDQLKEDRIAGLSGQELSDFVRQQEAIMMMQANQLFASWTPIPSQQYVEGEKPKEVRNTEGKLTDEQKKQMELINSDILKAGHIIFATLDTEVNSDETTPVMATIVQGPLKGSKVIGNFQRVEKKILLQFSVLSVPRLPQSIGINAVAIDPDTAKTAMASSVDNHYMLRYGTMLASGFLSGLGQAFQSSGSQITSNASGTVSSMPALSTAEKSLVALGNMAQQINTAMAPNINKAPTVKINPGVSIGLLLMADLVVPKK